MKKRIHYLLLTLTLLAGVVSLSAVGRNASAIDVFSGACGGGSTSTNGAGTGAGTGTTGTTGTGTTGATGGGSSDICGAAQNDKAENIVKNVINTMLYVLAIIAVIMIVIGGIRYTTSNGDSSQLKSAKDTILYAVVGLVVAIMAFAIVNFVITNVAKTPTSAIQSTRLTSLS
jgi:hypothetical protein